MKLTITGSLGHISRPLVQQLVAEGHNVTVISSNADRKSEIESLGANAAIGSIEDVDFLTKTFTGADAVYTMIPPNNYMDPDFELWDYYRRIGRNYRQAVEASGVTRVVNLSTIGAHMSSGNGILSGAHDVAKTLDTLPENVSLTHMRPTSFFYNLYSYMDMVKNMNAIYTNYGTVKIPFVSPKDIASAVAEELTTPFEGRKIRYVCSEELTGPETAAILGEAIGKPGLKWVVVSDEDTLKGLLSIGMNPDVAKGLTEMYGALETGALAEDYFKNRPELGPTKMKDFAVEFAAAYHNN